MGLCIKEHLGMNETGLNRADSYPRQLKRTGHRTGFCQHGRNFKLLNVPDFCAVTVSSLQGCLHSDHELEGHVFFTFLFWTVFSILLAL